MCRKDRKLQREPNRSECEEQPMPEPTAIPSWVRFLPTLNVTLNALSGIFLFVGWRFILRKQIARHRMMMLAAFDTSVLFLASYLTYHFYPGVGTVRFVEPAWARPIYLGILLPHILLAIAIVPLALLTLIWAWRGNYPAHRRIAKVTFPIWMFVSVSGVLVYLMLYVFFPQ